MISATSAHEPAPTVDAALRGWHARCEDCRKPLDGEPFALAPFSSRSREPLKCPCAYDDMLCHCGAWAERAGVVHNGWTVLCMDCAFADRHHECYWWNETYAED